MPAPLALAAEPPAAPPRAWTDWFQLHAFVTSSYLWNFNRPPSGESQLRLYDFHHNQFDIDAALTVQHEAVAPGDFGYRVELVAGTTIPRGTAARGLFRDPGAAVGGQFDLLQAFIRYVIPLGSGLRVDLGKFVSPFGYEYVDRYEHYNDHFSHSLLFINSPYTHTGLSLGYDFHSMVSAQLFVTSGWDNVLDNNDGKSVGLQVTLHPARRMDLALGYLVGPERDADNRSTRQFIDAMWSWEAVADRLTLGLDVNFTRDGGSSERGTLADEWYGVAGYLKAFAIPSRLAFCLRGEWFADPVSARTGTEAARMARDAQELYEVTFTPMLWINPHIVLRAEARLDQARRAAFETRDGGPGAGKIQPTLAVNALFTY